MIAPDQDLDALSSGCTSPMRGVWRDLVQRAERETWSYHDFLAPGHRGDRASAADAAGATDAARALSFLKTIDDFNFTYQSTLRVHMLGSRCSPDFVTEGRSLIFSGKPGRGKTHLAIAVALPRDSERLRCLLHDGRHAHR